MKVAAVLAFFLAIPFCAHSATIYVPDHYGSIQDAIDAALDGDTVIVRAGTYVENIDFIGKSITLVSESGPAPTVIDGGGDGSVVLFRNGEDSGSVLEGFTITNGTGTDWSSYPTKPCGGGIFIDGSSPTILGNLITGNIAEWDGYGAGVFCNGDAIIENNLISENEAIYGDGGGIWFNGSPLIRNNTILSNTVNSYHTYYCGGGIYCNYGSALIENNLIAYNDGSWGGGGIHQFQSNAVISNCTIINNSAGTGGGVDVSGITPITIVNSIIRGNDAWFAGNDDIAGNAVVTYSNIGSSFPGTGNISADPLFIEGTYLSQDPVQPGVVNPCVDAGDPSSTVVTGTTRTDGVQDTGVVDMGYHHAGPAAPIMVPDDFPTIQAAVNAAAGHGETVLVRPGIYLENIVVFRKNVVITSEKGPELTVIDGQGAGSVVTFEENSAGASLIGFTITNGFSTTDGGGILCSLANPIITGNRIEGNRAEDDGGGVALKDSVALLTGNVIANNSAGTLGTGGGLYLLESDATFSGDRLFENTAGHRGGGIAAYESYIEVINGLFVDNKAGLIAAGGGLALDDSGAFLTNVTFVGNSGYNGGALACCADATVTASNSIFWDNDAVSTGKEIYIGTGNHPSKVTLSYSDVKGGQASIHLLSGCTLEWGSGMIDADPLFIDPANSDFHLSWDSPCMNAGSNHLLLPEEDFEGDPRIHHGTVDMGADEFHLHLYSIGDVIPGSPIAVKVVGTPGTTPLTLGLGSGIQDPPQSTPFGDLYLQPPILMRLQMPAINSDGLSILSGTVPGSWLPGEQYPIQALVGTELTNLWVVIVE